MEHRQDTSAEISELKHTITRLKIQIEDLDRYLGAIRKELGFYKTMVEDCRNVFKKYPDPEREEKRTGGSEGGGGMPAAVGGLKISDD
ncbi:hypothetical protein HO133_010479 [Letharia lupina]|uniref:Uncharacterized protein n=1 Tax=Letharia lupina TaxID=560253 RepID=A0A8H6CLA7_9LECA|nr:uncharacterized protein HO133_010479 [Letharia lupina]KAF6225281.1 hypothetical protein HO133_010479 [Letharia lupina]